MSFRKTLLLNISWCFCERLRVKRARFLRFLNVLVFCCSFVGDYIQTSADDVIINQLQAISQLFSSNLPSGAFCQVSKLTIPNEHGRPWEMFIWSKLGQTPLEMHIGAFARIKNVTQDQLLATRAEIIQS